MKLLASMLMAAFLAAPVLPAIAAGETPAAPQANVKLDLTQGAARFAEVCVACHGADGNSTIVANPVLAQQHPEYLVKQLRDFKSGARKDPVMQGFAAMLSDQEMQNIAGWLASQKSKGGFAKDKELVALGERIFRGGIQDRNIAACAGCHSPNGAGLPVQYPRLAGQHADYTIKQLLEFRDGKRGNSLPMTQVAAKLNDREIKAVADYIAGLR